MPFTTADLANDVRSLPEIVIGTGTLNVQYRRPSSKYLDEVSELIRSSGGDRQTLKEIMGRQLVPILARWDFMEDDLSAAKEINAENLSLLPFEVQQEVLNGILAQERPSPNA